MRIGFGLGSTRMVLLIGGCAIKFPRFGILRMLKHLVKICLPKHAKWRKKRLIKYAKGGSLLHVAWNYLIMLVTSGIVANRQEHAISREHPELPLARVLHMYLGGLMLVMERGTPIPARKSVSLRKQFPKRCACDLCIAKHVCAFGEELRFIDYGHPNAREFLGIA